MEATPHDFKLEKFISELEKIKCVELVHGKILNKILINRRSCLDHKTRKNLHDCSHKIHKYRIFAKQSN